jgi:hypothetical protein
MSPEITAAIISTAGVIASAYLTYYLGRSDDRKAAVVLAEAKSSQLGTVAYALPTDGIRRSSPATPSQKLSDSGPPFDTRVTCDQKSDTLLFRIPPSFSNIFALIFTAGWLIAWTAGIFVVCYILVLMFMHPSQDDGAFGWFGPLFLSGWLVGALAGEYAVMKNFLSGILASFGDQFIIYDTEVLLVVRRMLFITRRAAYLFRHVQNMIATEAGLGFDYGKNKIVLTGVTENEANWIKQSIQQFGTAR